MIEPVVDGLPLGVGESLIGLQGVVDDDELGAPAGQHAADGCRQAESLPGSYELLQGRTLRRQLCLREECFIPGTGLWDTAF